MTEANKRTIQQQRIQQLQERLELYNAATTRNEATSSTPTSHTAALNTAAPAGTATASINKGGGGRPTRAPPPVSSPNPIPQPTPVSGVSESIFKSPHTTVSDQGGAPAPAPATAVAVGKTEGVRVASQQQRHHQTPPAPVPAPRLARSLAEDFVNSAAMSPLEGTAEARNGSSSSPSTAPATAAAQSASCDAAASNYPSTTANAAAHSISSPLNASDVFGYYNESDEEAGGERDEENDHVEYDIEEMDEYGEEEGDEEEDSTEEDDEGAQRRGLQPTLDNVLRSIFRAYSGSQEGHSTGLSSNERAASPLAHSPPQGSSSTTQAAPAAVAAAAAAGATHPLIQRAAELYRQHRLHQAHPLHHRSPFHTSDEAATRGFAGLHYDPEASSESSALTSEPTVEQDANSESDTLGDSDSCDSYLSPTAAHAALKAENAASASASPPPPVARSRSSAARTAAPPPASPGSFDQQEVAYRQLLLLQRGIEYLVERIGVHRFPQPLPHQDKAQALAQQRNLLVQKDMEMRAAPPGGASLEDVRGREAAALEAAVASIDSKCAAALQLARPVVDRGAAVESKRRVLKQREQDLAQQREARIIVEREIAKLEDSLVDRKERLKKREADYNAQLRQHNEQQNAAQQQIGEVEQLSKLVSSWLAILEERDRRLARKEKRLQRVQADLTRRNEDVAMWKKVTQKIKQTPPPPSPPRIN
ncbi:hypothetical protein ABL78_2195 [Leptomonas seymouri]|uniref:Uncharacterized protein n=1 Tax=Leptomonas seymouri TaxID=5684 RepID=A0A0N1PDA1_LEPSE|nr:hypothetical protein ABL78_2195 [Leptomonas seymouri]|eukprot:KPI88735.1 hypothetical protein ABL78_2195 [Leptomonas seymouri]